MKTMNSPTAAMKKQFLRELVDELADAAYNAGVSCSNDDFANARFQEAQDRLCRALGLDLDSPPDTD